MRIVMKKVVWLLYTHIFMFVSGERTRDKMYESISGAICFRRLNGTHQTGCSSSQSGSAGVLHLIRFEEDFNFLLNGPPAPPYAAVVPPHLFTHQHMLRLRNQAGSNVSVVLLINSSSSKMTQFSNELNCPNQYSGILLPNRSETATCNARKPEESWNPYGSGLLHVDFPFPIYYIADSDEIEKIINCFERFNNFNYDTHAQRRLCAVDVDSFMSAAVSSEVCMRRTNLLNNLDNTQYCDPLEGRNVYATLIPRNISSDVETTANEAPAPNAEERFILLSCRMDTTSMFDGVGLGALDSLFGYATLVSSAHMLSKLLPGKESLRDKRLNVLFVVFNGESYDYIGSQRFVYDLENLAFPTRSTHNSPISLNNIEFMIDIGVLDTITTLQLHSVTEFPASKAFLERLRNASSAYDLKIQFDPEIGYHIPPTSAQSFLRKNISFPAVVLNSQPLNKFYHSIYDNAENCNFTYWNTSQDYTDLMEQRRALGQYSLESVQMKVRNVSTALALAVYETLTGVAYADSKLANPILIDEFLYCFLESADCPLFKAASRPNSLPGLPIPPMRYITASQEASGWTYRLFGYLLSHKRSEVPQQNCTNLPLHWFAGYDGRGECRLTTQNYSQALSPAFIIEGYDWKSGQYSTWTESRWSYSTARIFLRPSRIHEAVTLSIGFVILIISFCLVYIISSRSQILFEDAPSSTDALTEPTAC